MTTVSEFDTPTPSAVEIQQLLARTTEKPSRPRYLALLAASLTGASLCIALLVTEGALPLRTTVALAVTACVGLGWSAIACWTIVRSGVLLGFHRVVAARMAAICSALFTVGVGLLGLFGQRGTLANSAWLGAFVTGVTLTIASALLLRSAQKKFRELSSRRLQLETQLRNLTAALVLLLTLSVHAPESYAQGAAQSGFAATETPAMFTVSGESIPVIEGRFRVPLNRTANSTTMLTLAYVRFKSTSPAPRPPIVFLAGGPGDAATRALAGMPRTLLNELLSIADVIAFDQRGTGQSEPRNAICAPGEFLARDRASDPAQFIEILRPRVELCIRNAVAQGVDVSGLTTQESADDIEALRHVTGASRLLLLGGSYGTHLALATAKRYPTSIAGMVLAGVEGLDDTFKLPSRVDSVLDAIAKSKRPSLVADLRTLRARLASEPARFTFPAGQVIVLGEWDLQRWVSESLDAVPKIDAMLNGVGLMLEGNFTSLAQWALGFRIPKPLGLMNLAMDCASYATESRLHRIDQEKRSSVLGTAINYPLPDICGVPGLSRLPDSFRNPFSVNVPALLISGTFDGRTPPSNAIDAARNLPNAKLLRIDGASHSLFREEQVTVAMLQFFRGIR